MKIIVHIGAGKTGTTSIQTTLQRAKKQLNLIGIHFMGLILEHAASIKYDWQSFPAGNLLRMSDERLREEVLDIFETSIPIFEKQGIHTLIWSNESFLNYSEKIIPILQALGDKYEIKIIVFVRSYESWIQSAYFQWGIKHKTYTGKIKKFREWYSHDKILFYKKIKPYLSIFPGKVTVKNMSAQKNLVKSFFESCDIPHKNIKIFKANESPSFEELLLRSLFNNNFNDANILPNLFDEQVLNKSNLLLQTPLGYLQQLMPTADDLNKITSDVKEDRIMLNKLLKEAGEEEIVFGNDISKKIKVDTNKLLMMALQIIMQQSIRISQMEQKINKII